MKFNISNNAGKFFLSLMLLIISMHLSFASTPNDSVPRFPFAFSNYKGDTLTFEQLDGKVVFINIWAIWCGPCIGEMPGLKKLYDSYKDDPKLIFLFVDADENLAGAEIFMKMKKYHLPVYKALNGFPKNLYRGALPTTMFFNKNGKVIMYFEGAADYGNPAFIKDFGKFLKDN